MIADNFMPSVSVLLDPTFHALVCKPAHLPKFRSVLAVITVESWSLVTDLVLVLWSV